LLITRGIEAASDLGVFTSFEKHFIEAGLVDARFRWVVEAAQHTNVVLLRAHGDEVLALADAVKALYDSMDNSLRFPAETAAAAAPPPVEKAKAIVARDYRGVACPMNFVKVKLDLARMQRGERVRVLLDDGPPIENVPRSVALEGHKVLQQERAGEHWAVLIEKN
jgi:sulfite reductase (ferredoxin)